ncbi:hypothetical protein ACYZTX_03965 [Pseudomonas sp. MDT1-17]
MNNASNSTVEEATIQRSLRVSRLDVRFEAPGIEFRRIFANGRMQVRVRVFVEAVDDGSGIPVPLTYYPDLISTRLIQYHDGQPLSTEVYTGEPLTGWNSAPFENSYTHNMPGATYAPGGGNNTGTPIDFWVSCSNEETMQIAAEVTVQGRVYRSNGTVNPDGSKINKSVVIVAERVPTYSADQFSWKRQRIEGAFYGATLYRYDLGLYLNGLQVKLVNWHTDQYEGSGIYPMRFCYTGLVLSHPAPKSYTGVMLPVLGKAVEIIGFKLPVKQREGELVACKGIPSAYKYTGEQVRLEDFFFTVLDEFGSTHRLSVTIDIEKGEFLLRKG